MLSRVLRFTLALCVLTSASVSFANVYPNPFALWVGERVIAVDSVKDMTIISAQNNGLFVVRDLSGNVYSNIAASDLAVTQGCYNSLCAGQPVIALDSNKFVTVIGLQNNGQYVVLDRDGNRYANIGLDDLSPESGCNLGMCAGEYVIAVDSLKSVVILSAQRNGLFVVEDSSQNVYSNISADDLAVRQGCEGNLCVNRRAIALDSNKYVTLIALQRNGTFVVEDDSGNMYANIGTSDLSPLNQ